LAALGSHFLIDMLPHWDYVVNGPPKNRQKVLVGEFFLLLVLVIIFFILYGGEFWFGFLGGMIAISPDLMWLPHTYYGRPVPVTASALGRIRSAHAVIQWSESHFGLITEIVWAISMASLLVLKGIKS
jgi:uncharacterized membrane protein